MAILLLSQSLTVVAQNRLDVSISNLKKVWNDAALSPTPQKLYFNKVQKLIDIGEGEDFHIPIDSNITYVFETSFSPPKNMLKFSWTTIDHGPSPIGNGTIERSIELPFKSKDACYSIIDAIFDLRKAYSSDNR